MKKKYYDNGRYCTVIWNDFGAIVKYENGEKRLCKIGRDRWGRYAILEVATCYLCR